MPSTMTASSTSCGCATTQTCLESICSNTATWQIADGENTPLRICLAKLPAPIATARAITAPNVIRLDRTQCFTVGDKFILACSAPFCETETPLPVYTVASITPSTATAPGQITVTPPFPATFTGTVDYTPQTAIAGCPVIDTVSSPTLIGLVAIDWGLEFSYYTELSSNPVAFNVLGVSQGASAFTILKNNWSQENFNQLNPGDLISIPSGGITNATITKVYQSNGEYVIEINGAATLTPNAGCASAKVVHAVNSAAFEVIKDGDCWAIVPKTNLLSLDATIGNSGCNGRPSRHAGRYAAYAKYSTAVGMQKRLVLSGDIHINY